MTDDREGDDEAARRAIERAILVGPARALDLFSRVPALMRRRGWGDDPDLTYVLAAALSLKKLHAGRTVFRRPAAAGECGGLWPESVPRRTAFEIVDLLDLGELLEMP